MVSTHCFMDADHSGDRDTRRSQNGVLIFVNKAPILYYSKQHNTDEKSTFSSEFVALKTLTELVKDLWHKLWVFDIPIYIPTTIFCDNESVNKKALTPESTLNKNNVNICYHKCREAVAAGVDWIAQ